jgi:hypothetical protein
MPYDHFVVGGSLRPGPGALGGPSEPRRWTVTDPTGRAASSPWGPPLATPETPKSPKAPELEPTTERSSSRSVTAVLSPARAGAVVASVPARLARSAPDLGVRHALHRFRSAVALVVIALGLGIVLASALGLIIWAISSGLHHAANA